MLDKLISLIGDYIANQQNNNTLISDNEVKNLQEITLLHLFDTLAETNEELFVSLIIWYNKHKDKIKRKNTLSDVDELLKDYTMLNSTTISNTKSSKNKTATKIAKSSKDTANVSYSSGCGISTYSNNSYYGGCGGYRSGC